MIRERQRKGTVDVQVAAGWAEMPKNLNFRKNLTEPKIVAPCRKRVILYLYILRQP